MTITYNKDSTQGFLYEAISIFDTTLSHGDLGNPEQPRWIIYIIEM